MNKGIIRKSLISFLSIVLLILIVPFSVVKADMGIYINSLDDSRINVSTTATRNGNTISYNGGGRGNGVTITFDSTNYNLTNNKVYINITINSISDNRYMNIMIGQPNATALQLQNWTVDGRVMRTNVLGTYDCIFDINADGNLLELNFYKSNSSGSTGANSTGNYSITINSIYIGLTPYQPNDFGKIKDLSFYTNYISQPNTNKNITMSYNQDVIKWNNAVSDNGTQYNDNFNIEIHAERFKYIAPTISELMTKTLQDMNVLTDSEINLGSYSVLLGNKDFTWKDVASAFLGTSNVYTFFDQLSPVFDNVENIYTMYGWYYKVRLINSVDNYEGEWQIVYNMTTLPETSDSIITNYYVNYNYDFNYVIDNSIKTINEMNGTNSMYFLNNEVVNINYNDYTSDINNTTNNIDNQYNNMHDIEINLFNELDNKLNDFELKDFDTDVDNSFVSSINWVNQQFNNAVGSGSNPLGQFVYIVVSIGIVLLIVGILV